MLGEDSIRGGMQGQQCDEGSSEEGPEGAFVRMLQAGLLEEERRSAEEEHLIEAAREEGDRRQEEASRLELMARQRDAEEARDVEATRPNTEAIAVRFPDGTMRIFLPPDEPDEDSLSEMDSDVLEAMYNHEWMDRPQESPWSSEPGSPEGEEEKPCSGGESSGQSLIAGSGTIDLTQSSDEEDGLGGGSGAGGGSSRDPAEPADGPPVASTVRYCESCDRFLARYMCGYCVPPSHLCHLCTRQCGDCRRGPFCFTHVIPVEHTCMPTRPPPAARPGEAALREGPQGPPPSPGTHNSFGIQAERPAGGKLIQLTGKEDDDFAKAEWASELGHTLEALAEPLGSLNIMALMPMKLRIGATTIPWPGIAAYYQVEKGIVLSVIIDMSLKPEVDHVVNFLVHISKLNATQMGKHHKDEQISVIRLKTKEAESESNVVCGGWRCGEGSRR